MSRNSLWSQPSSFWIGAFMVAEAPVILALTFVETDRRQNALDYMFSNPLALMCAAVAILALGLLVGWLGHRIGFGQ